MTSRASGEWFSFSQKANYWNDLYAHPASLFEHHMRRRMDYATQYILTHFAPEIRVLDMGCGAGVLSEKLIENGYAVTAADASPDMLELARERLKRFPADSHRLFQANCLHLPFADGEFDLIVSLGMFGYFDEVTQALSELHRVLKPGGTLMISVRNKYTQSVFDLFQVLKQPFRLAWALGRRLTRKLSPAASSDALPGAASAASPGEVQSRPDDGFRIQIYQAPSALIDGVSQRGYWLVDFDGLGYGPVTFAQKKFFSEAFSIRLSDFLDRQFRASGLNTLSRWFADVSFYVFERHLVPSGSRFPADHPVSKRSPRPGTRLPELRALWERLEPAAPSPTERFAWWQACLEGLPDVGRNQPFLVRDGEKGGAIAPLVRRPGWLPRLESMGVRQLHEPMDFVYSSRPALAALCGQLADQRLPIDLPRVPRESPLADELRRAFKGRGLVRVTVGTPYPYLEIDPDWKTPETRFNAGRRSDFRRALSHAEKSGQVTFEVLGPEPEHLQGLLNEAYQTEMQSWKGRQGSALALDSKRADFYWRYFRSCSEKGILRLAFMRIGGVAIAMQIAVQTNNRLWLLKIGYNDAYARCSPGTLLMLHVVGHAARTGLLSIEFLGAAEPWTAMWSKRVRECVRIRVYPAGIAGAAAFVADGARWAMKQVGRRLQHAQA